MAYPGVIFGFIDVSKTSQAYKTWVQDVDQFRTIHGLTPA